MATAPGPQRLVSRSTGRRRLWGALGAVVFGLAALWALVDFVRAPHVDSGVLLVIALSFLALAIVLGWEGAQSGVVTLDETGYRSAQGGHRAWSDVLAVGTGRLEGRDVPVVAVRSDEGFGLVEDAFPGFADEDAPALVAALRERAGLAGLSGVEVPQAWWDEAEAEADRVEAVTAASGRRPVSRDRVPFGHRDLATAVRLDYGLNDAGERVEVFCRRAADLALTTADGRRWLRQNGKRSADPATQVGALFGPHEVAVVPSDGAGFDRLRVTVPGSRTLVFNAEEPDRF